MTVEVRVGTVEDAMSLAPRLRHADKVELELSSGPDVERTLKVSVECSTECFAALEDGAVICLWGVCINEELGLGSPWMVASDAALRHPRKIVSIGRDMVARWDAICECLTNFTHEDNVVHHRWLSHIGFTLLPSAPYGPSKAPFIQFYRYRKCADQQQ